MAFRSTIQNLNTSINAWFTEPEINAAGKMGIFRILYSLFYLWHLSTHSTDFLSGMPSFYVVNKVYLVKYFFSDFGTSFSPLFFHVLESFLVAALVMLAFGYKTRVATILVLLIGCLTEGLATAVDGKRTLLPLVFYVPFFMSISNSWGHTYSLDSLIKKHKSGFQVDPHASNWEYFLPARALLIIFSILFFNSVIFKVAFGGAWLSYSDMMANFFLNRNIEAAVYDLPLNWLAPHIAQMPLIYLGSHITTLIFETFFFLSLFNRKIRDIFVSLALIFHAINGLWLVVTVTPILIGYGAFIDWQAIKDFFFPPKKGTSSPNTLSPKLLTLLVLFLATVSGLLWHSSVGFRALFNLNGLIDWRTIWYPVLPLALGWLVAILISLRRTAKMLP